MGKIPGVNHLDAIRALDTIYFGRSFSSIADTPQKTWHAEEAEEAENCLRNPGFSLLPLLPLRAKSFAEYQRLN